MGRGKSCLGNWRSLNSLSFLLCKLIIQYKSLWSKKVQELPGGCVRKNNWREEIRATEHKTHQVRKPELTLQESEKMSAADNSIEGTGKRSRIMELIAAFRNIARES